MSLWRTKHSGTVRRETEVTGQSDDWSGVQACVYPRTSESCSSAGDGAGWRTMEGISNLTEMEEGLSGTQDHSYSRRFQKPSGSICG